MPVRRSGVAAAFTSAAVGGGGSNPAPAFLLAQTVRTWSQPFTNTPGDVAPSPLPANTTGFAGKFAWGGGRITQEGLRLFGGGDADYGGNDEQLGTLASLAFSTVRNSSVTTGGTETTWGDGQPRPPHTYSYFVKTPTHLYLCCMPGPYLSNNTIQDVWKRALPSGDWTFVTTLTGVQFGPMTCGAVYSPTRDLIYIFTSYGEPWVLDPSDDSVTHPEIPAFVAGADGHNSIELIDAADAIVYLAGTGEVSTIDLDDLAAGWDQQTISGTFGVSNYAGLAWHNRSQKLTGWGHDTNRGRIYTLAPPTAPPTQYSHTQGTWTASFVALGGLTPTSPDTNGTHKRYGIIEYDEVDAAVLINATNQEPFVGALDAL